MAAPFGSGVRLLGADGLPIAQPVRGHSAPGRAVASASASTAHSAADPMSQELAGWWPRPMSADAQILPERDAISGRSADLVRNDGWASGGLKRLLDSVIGAGLRLSAKPDWRALGLDAEWAAEFATAWEAEFRTWATHPDGIDATGGLDWGGWLRVQGRHRIVDGEGLSVVRWMPERGTGYATRLQPVAPVRLCNAMGARDTARLRGGVSIDADGRPEAYHIRGGVPGDPLAAADAYSWIQVAARTPWGRRQVIHDYDREEADQTRGRSLFTPILERLRMVTKYDRTELQAAVLNAVFAAFLESPFDHSLLREALDDTATWDASLAAYQDQRAAFHEARGIKLNGVRIPTFFPGERLAFANPSRPAAQFGQFEAACLRHIAAGLGLSYEMLSQDWSQVNYSSARAALLEIWKGLTVLRESLARQSATPAMLLVLEEAIDRKRLPMPKGAPEFWAFRGAYGRCRWIGPGRGWVDPVKEAQASVLRMEAGLSTLESECAEQGEDYQEVLAQRAREIKEMRDLGLPLPSWAAAQVFGPAGGAPFETAPAQPA